MHLNLNQQSKFNLPSKETQNPISFEQILNRERGQIIEARFQYRTNIMISHQLSLMTVFNASNRIQSVSCLLCWANGVLICLQNPVLESLLRKLNIVSEGDWSGLIKMKRKLSVNMSYNKKKEQVDALSKYFIKKIKDLIPKLVRQLSLIGLIKAAKSKSIQMHSKKLEMLQSIRQILQKPFQNSQKSQQSNLNAFQGTIPLQNINQIISSLQWEKPIKSTNYFQIHKKQLGLEKINNQQGQQNSHQKQVVIKSLLKTDRVSEEIGKQKLKREWNIIKLLKGDSFIKYWQYNNQEQLMFMQYISNNLTYHIYNGNSNITETLQIFQSILKGVKNILSQGIIHRDLKPDNILLENKGQKTQAKIIDFGQSISLKMRQSSQNQQKGLQATFPYSPYECYLDRKHLSENTDVWSCGVILYQMTKHEVISIYPFFYDNQSYIGLKRGQFQVIAGIKKQTEIKPIFKPLMMLISHALVSQPSQRITIQQFIKAVKAILKFTKYYEKLNINDYFLENQL